jgi:hypothetical protein
LNYTSNFWVFNNPAVLGLYLLEYQYTPQHSGVSMGVVFGEGFGILLRVLVKLLDVKCLKVEGISWGIS